jgi:hypothetical protein
VKTVNARSGVASTTIDVRTAVVLAAWVLM